MKPKKITSYKLPNILKSRNKWARRGRAIIHFLFSILITTANYIADLIILICKEIHSFTTRIYQTKKAKPISVLPNHNKLKHQNETHIYNNGHLDKKTIKSILKRELIKRQTAGDIDIEEIADRIEIDNYSEKDLIMLVEEAEKRAIRRNAVKKQKDGESYKPSPLCMGDFLKVLETFEPNVKDESK